MSLAGLERSEKLSQSLYRKILKSLEMQLGELKQELLKVQYLLGDPKAAREWASAPANPDRIGALSQRLDDVEQLYLTAGDSRAAMIFKSRMEKALQDKLTNLKANELEVNMRIAQSKSNMQTELLTGLTNIKRDGALHEMYSEARESGGFFSTFGRPYLADLVTLETKAAGSKTIGEYMNNLYDQYEKGLKDVFVYGIVRGDSYEKMEQNLQDATGITAGKAKILIRTEANAIFNQSVLDVIDDNPLVKGYRFRAVLDGKTSDICQEHDGQYIPKEDVQPGVNYPPLHPNCRSTVTTVIVGEDVQKDITQRYTKNGKNQWEEVPPGMTYSQYKERFGFANSANPAAWEPPVRNIHDTNWARPSEPQYHGYVKASRSGPTRIRKIIDQYIDDRDLAKDELEYYSGRTLVGQAMLESGFDGLPTEMTTETFDKFAQEHDLTSHELVFKSQEDLDAFVKGEYKEPVTALSPEEAAKLPESKRKYRLTIATRNDDRVAKPGKDKSMTALGHVRYEEMKAKGIQNDSQVGEALRVQYGYDAYESKGKLTIYNRTSVIIRQDVAELPEIEKPKDLKKEDFVAVKTHQDWEDVNSKNRTGYEYARYVNDDVVKEKFGMVAVHDIPGAQGRAIYRYTGSSYGWMNSEGRDYMSGKISAEELSPAVKDCIRGLYKYGDKAKHGIMLSRGTGFGEMGAYFKQNGIRMPDEQDTDIVKWLNENLSGMTAFLEGTGISTSASDVPAFKHKRIWLHLYAPEPTRMVRAITEDDSAIGGEGEIMLMPGQGVTFVDAKKTEDGKIHIYGQIVPELIDERILALLGGLAEI